MRKSNREQLSTKFPNATLKEGAKLQSLPRKSKPSATHGEGGDGKVSALRISHLYPPAQIP